MRRIFFHDLGWKAFSVFLAVLIWLTVHRILEDRTPGNPVTFAQIPILVVAAAADVHAFRVSPATVDVTLTGNSEALAILQTNELHAFINLTGFPGTNASADAWRPVDVAVPPGVTILQIEPAKVGVIAPPPGS